MKRMMPLVLVAALVVVSYVLIRTNSSDRPTDTEGPAPPRVIASPGSHHRDESSSVATQLAGGGDLEKHSAKTSSRSAAAPAKAAKNANTRDDSIPSAGGVDGDTTSRRPATAPERRPLTAPPPPQRHLDPLPDGGATVEDTSVHKNGPESVAAPDGPDDVFSETIDAVEPNRDSPADPNAGMENDADDFTDPVDDTDDVFVRQLTREFILSGVATDETTGITDLLDWRERLLDAAWSDPNSSWTPEAFFQAARISGILGEREERMRCLKAGVEHPLVEPTAKMFALEELAGLESAEADGIGRAFEYLNEACEVIKQLPPKLRKQWDFRRSFAVFRKAMMLDRLAVKGVIHPELPGPDAGLTASDYTQMLLDMPTERLAAAGLDTNKCMWLLYQARQFVREGKREQAAQNYHKALQYPELEQPPTFIAYCEAGARYDPHTLEFAKALENIEKSFPPDKWSRTLSLNIAHAYWMAGLPEKYISRARRLLESDDPQDQEYLASHPLTRADILYRIAQGYDHRLDPPDPHNALKYYELLLDEFPDHFDAERVWQRVDILSERLARRESHDNVPPPVNNEEKNK